MSKIIFKTKYLTNLLWIVWNDYMKISEWLICVENDIYISMKYFLLYLDCERWYDVVDGLWYWWWIHICEWLWCCGDYIYLDWLWYGWWIHICWLFAMLLVNTYMLIELWMLLVIAYMLNEWWWCGELFVWTYALLWVICSSIHDWWWRILYLKCKTGVKSYIQCFCCIEGDDLEVIWYRMHLEGSRTLHAFE